MKQIYCLGPFNSGTNLINNILANNQCYDNKTSTFVEVIDSPELWFDNCRLKHSFNLDSLKKYFLDNNCYIIIMYKNVFNWLYSIKKSEYDLHFDKIDKPLTFNGHTFDNLIDVYNKYYNFYIELEQNYENILFLDYYKIINSVNSFNYINNKLHKFNFSLVSEEQFKCILSKPAKSHGDCVINSKQALDIYLHNQIMVQHHIKHYTNMYKYVNQNIIDKFKK
jgi:hypothetical protein